MARLFDDASNEYLEVGSVPDDAAPLTLACWFNCDDNSGNYYSLMGIGDVAAANYFWLLLEGSPTGQQVRAQIAAASAGVAETSTTWTLNTWEHAAAVFTSNVLRAAFLDGGGKGTNTTDLTPSGLDNTTIGTLHMSSAYYYYMSGSVADAAVWNVALTDADVAMLALGLCPLLIRPDALVAYWPLGGIYGRHDNDLLGGYDMTAYNTPTWADHPTKLIYPNSGIVMPHVAAAPASDPLVLIPNLMGNIGQRMTGGMEAA